MSCFAVLCADTPGAHQRGAIAAMLAPMRRRAPDGEMFAQAGPVLLGQALLRTGTSAAEGPARLTLDRDLWVVADARIDARADLIKRLRAAGRDVAFDAPHAELALHACHAFGSAFTDHLLGDFALVFWDSRRGQLLAVRDPFGARPLYFARLRDGLALASDIAALLALPEVSRELDPVAVADFLMFGAPMEAHATVYRQIRCLPPGGRLHWSRSEMRIDRHWSLGPIQEVRFRRPADYVGRFRELLELAVRDRLPEGPLSIPLSAGMDSTSIAACAVQGRAADSITAYHVSARTLESGDDEYRYARDFAGRLGLRYVEQQLGDHSLFERARSIVATVPSPAPLLAVHAEMVEDMERRGVRVLLSGYQGDAVFFPTPTYYTALLRSGRWLKFAKEAAGHVRHARSLRGMALRTLWRPAFSAPPWKPALPAWLPADLVSDHGLQARWDHWWDLHERAVDPVSQLQLPWAQRAFEALEFVPGPFVARYPFLDLRLVRFALGLPAYLRRDKAILREAMRGLLPEAIRIRPKTGAAGDPVRKLVTSGKLPAMPQAAAAAQRAGFIDGTAFAPAWQRYREGEGSDSTWASWLILHPVALANWLELRQESS